MVHNSWTKKWILFWKTLLFHINLLVFTHLKQNGLVERMHIHLINYARALKFHVSLLIVFWEDCLLTTTYLINRTPTTTLKNQSPYQVLFNCLPDHCQLGIFSYLCYLNVISQSGDKFAARSIKGVFLGYSYSKKGYKVLI